MTPHEVDLLDRDRQGVLVRYLPGFGRPFEPGADRARKVPDPGIASVPDATERDVRMEVAIFELEFVLGEGLADRIPECLQAMGGSVEPEPEHARPFHFREDAEVRRAEGEWLMPGDDPGESHADDLRPLGFNLAEEVQGDVDVVWSRPADRPLLLLEAGDAAVDEVDHIRRKRHGQEEAPRGDR